MEHTRKTIVAALKGHGIKQQEVRHMLSAIPDIFIEALLSGGIVIRGAFSLTLVEKKTRTYTSTGYVPDTRIGVKARFSKVDPKVYKFDRNLIRIAEKHGVRESTFKRYLSFLRDTVINKNDLPIRRLGKFIKTTRRASRGYNVVTKEVSDRKEFEYMRFTESKYLREVLSS